MQKFGARALQSVGFVALLFGLYQTIMNGRAISHAPSWSEFTDRVSGVSFWLFVSVGALTLVVLGIWLEVSLQLERLQEQSVNSKEE